MALRRTLRLPASAESAAPLAPRLSRGMAIAAMMPMITTTMTSSIRLKPLRLLRRVADIPCSYGFPFLGHPKPISGRCGETLRTPTPSCLIPRGECVSLDAQKRAFACRLKNGRIICHAGEPIAINGLADFDQHSVDECAGAISRQYQSRQSMGFIKTW